MHKLPVEDLRDWMQAGDSRLELVFVSACHSRSAGEAFLQAGVRHVVCCQRDDQPVLNLSCVLFARAFYQALAHGRILREAFALAQKQVLCCAHLSRDERRKEVEKFVLLPEDGDHDVIIFEPSSSSPPMSRPRSSKTLRPSLSSVSSQSNQFLPVPTHIFEGRQVELYRVLDALKSARVVRVTGPAGVGKGSVVQRVCRYIQDRQRLFSREIAEIQWLPSPEAQQGQDDYLSKLLTTFCSIFAATANSSPDGYQQCQRNLLSYLRESKVLLVIDTRMAQSPQSSSKIAAFLKDVVSHTTHTRVICIHQIGASIVQKLPCSERDVYLNPLDFFTTVRLFGRLCQYVHDRRYIGVSTPAELCTLLLPDTNFSSAAADKPRTRRGRDIFQMIGEGIPAKIHFAAKNMSEKDYDRMISLGLRKEHVLDFQSRVELEKELSDVSAEVQKAVEEQRFLDAKDCQERLDEMEILRERLHDLPTLMTLAESVASDQELAIRAKDFAAASVLQEERGALEQKISVEKAAMEELGISEDELKLPAKDKEKRGTRVDLEIQIKSLDTDLDEACVENDFAKARKIDAQIEGLKKRRSSLPTKEQLLNEVSELRNSLKQAKDARDWDLAEDLFSQMKETQERLDAEIQAATLFGVDEKAEINVGIDKPGAVAVAGLNSDRDSPAIDPNGDHANDMVEDNEESEKYTSDRITAELPVARPVVASDESSALRLIPHFRVRNTTGNNGKNSASHNDQIAEELHAKTVAGASSTEGTTSKLLDTRSTPTSIDGTKGNGQAIVHEQEGSGLKLSPTLACNEEFVTVTSSDARSTGPDRSDNEQLERIHMASTQDVSNVSAPHAAMRIGHAVTALARHAHQNALPDNQDPPQWSNMPPPRSAEETNYAASAFTAETYPHGDPQYCEIETTSYYRPQPGRTPANDHSVSPMAQSYFNRSMRPPQINGAPFSDAPMGHTNRLVLEQMIQESISSMAVPAMRVEAVNSPVPPTRKAKKKGVRTLFGLKKSFR